MRTRKQIEEEITKLQDELKQAPPEVVYVNFYTKSSVTAGPCIYLTAEEAAIDSVSFANLGPKTVVYHLAP